jgi:hypothetical protein
VAYSFKTGIVEEEKTSIARLQQPEQPVVARQWLCKHIFTARDRRNIQTHNNRETVGSGVFCYVCAEVISGEAAGRQWESESVR